MWWSSRTFGRNPGAIAEIIARLWAVQLRHIQRISVSYTHPGRRDMGRRGWGGWRVDLGERACEQTGECLPANMLICGGRAWLFRSSLVAAVLQTLTSELTLNAAGTLSVCTKTASSSRHYKIPVIAILFTNRWENTHHRQKACLLSAF